MDEERSLEGYLRQCRQVVARRLDHGDALAREYVLAAVARHVAAAQGLDLAKWPHLLPLASYLDGDLEDLPAPPARIARPELLSMACEAVQPATQRKSSGVFYTPERVARRVCVEVIDGLRVGPTNALICDPAAGGGIFLLAAARELVARGARAREVVERGLQAVELDPLAADVARTALGLFGWDGQGAPPAARVTVGDALIGARRQDLMEWAASPDPQLSLLADLLPEPGEGESLRAHLDAWAALWVWPENRPRPDVDEVLRRATDPADPMAELIAQLRESWHFVHWDLLSDRPFDAIVGNPPYLSQLSKRTVRPAGLGPYLQSRFGNGGRGYADTAILFLLLALELVADEGRIGLLLPDSFMAARDAAAARLAAGTRSRLTWIWRSVDHVFDAHVRVCAPVLTAGKPAPEPTYVHRAVGREIVQVEPVVVDPLQLSSGTWSWLFADSAGVPCIDVHAAHSLDRYCRATADFRDQYYGLAPYVFDEGEPGHPSGEEAPRLITVGLIDPARCLWGERSTRFAKRSFARPRVDLRRLRAESPLLYEWAIARLSPKVVLATQTKVLEVLVDQVGVLMPSVPAVSVYATHGRLWHLAAALSSPVLTMRAARDVAGAALSHDAIKLSARQVEALPAPREGSDWDEAAQAFQAASAALREAEWRHYMGVCAARTCSAYGLSLEEQEHLLLWWSARLPRWRGQA